MKNKGIWITILVIILLVILFWGFKTNWGKIPFSFKSNNVTPTTAVTGMTKRLIAPLPGQQSDYSAIDLISGKPIWIWSGGLPCPEGYMKTNRGEDAGWCKLIAAATA